MFVPRATPPNNNNDRQAVRGLKASMNHCMQLQHRQAVPACRRGAASCISLDCQNVPLRLAGRALSPWSRRASSACNDDDAVRLACRCRRFRCKVSCAVASLTPFPPPPWQPPALQSKLGRGRCLAAGCRRRRAAEQDSSPPSDVRNLGATTANKCQGVIKSIIVMNPRRHWWRRRHG